MNVRQRFILLWLIFQIFGTPRSDGQEVMVKKWWRAHVSNCGWTSTLTKNICPCLAEAGRWNKVARVVRGNENISSTTPDTPTVPNPTAYHSINVANSDISIQLIITWSQNSRSKIFRWTSSNKFSCCGWFWCALLVVVSAIRSHKILSPIDTGQSSSVVVTSLSAPYIVARKCELQLLSRCV